MDETPTNSTPIDQAVPPDPLRTDRPSTVTRCTGRTCTEYSGVTATGVGASATTTGDCTPYGAF